MTARRDLTDDHMSHLRACAAQGMSLTMAAKEMGVAHGWITKSARRLGMLHEIERLFPEDYQEARRFRLSGEQIDRLRAMAETGATRIDMARKIGCCDVTLNKAIRAAGIYEELKDIARQARERKASDIETGALPRDVCPAVQWLTKAWRVAA